MMNIMRQVMVTVVLGAVVLLAADAGASVTYESTCEDVICDRYAEFGGYGQFSDEAVMDADNTFLMSETDEGAEHVEEFYFNVA